MASTMDVARRAGTTTETVQAVLDAIADIVRKGENVIYQGFGTFSKKHKEAYTGRNPATGAAVEVPAKVKLHFKPSDGLDMSTPKSFTPRRRRGR